MYYVFGFLMVVFVILVITTIESTILLCYFHLCSEVSAKKELGAVSRRPAFSALAHPDCFLCSFKNYHWWWRSFLTGGAAALYLFCYEILFYFRSVFSPVQLSLRLGTQIALPVVDAPNSASEKNPCRRMEVSGSASFFLYTGYSVIASLLFWVMTGTLGFFGCFAFVRKIYSIVKVD
jgi:transmembrane 9 superfamily protein 2/4